MTVFFQHVGEAGGARDFPKTIGTPKSGLRRFEFTDVESDLAHLQSEEIEQLRLDTAKYAPEGFQIWGIPSGAKSVLNAFQVGDYLLLLEAVGPGGTFAYAGRAIGKPSQECFELSLRLWGEQRFPLIIFLRGNLTNYGWIAFCENLGYSTNWNPAGNTYRVQNERLLSSLYGNEEGLVRAIAGHDILLEPVTVAADLLLQDLAELDFQDEEGRVILRQHLQRERSARLVLAFRRTLSDFSCCVCGFDFFKAYGELGRGFVEAHHVKPVSQLKPNETVRLEDLVPVCSNCHRMLHRKYPAMDWEMLRELLAQVYVSRH